MTNDKPVRTIVVTESFTNEEIYVVVDSIIRHKASGYFVRLVFDRLFENRELYEGRINEVKKILRNSVRDVLILDCFSRNKTIIEEKTK